MSEKQVSTLNTWILTLLTILVGAIGWMANKGYESMKDEQKEIKVSIQEIQKDNIEEGKRYVELKTEFDNLKENTNKVNK